MTLSTSEVLDDAGDAVARIAAPWVGLLWLTAVPVRLAQVHFVARVVDLGDEVAQYGDHLLGIALAAGLAFLVSLWGRAVFVRACGLALRSLRPPGAEAFRVPFAAGLSYAYTALVVEALFFALGWTGVALPIVLSLSALAAATFPLNERPGLLRPLREVGRHAAPVRVLAALAVLFAVAWVVAFVNLFFLFRVGLWMAGGLPWAELSAWDALLALDNPRFLLVLGVGATLAVEPFWLGAHVVFVHKVRSRESGEDLRLWFDRLRSAAA